MQLTVAVRLEGFSLVSYGQSWLALSTYRFFISVILLRPWNDSTDFSQYIPELVSEGFKIVELLYPSTNLGCQFLPNICYIYFPPLCPCGNEVWIFESSEWHLFFRVKITVMSMKCRITLTQWSCPADFLPQYIDVEVPCFFAWINLIIHSVSLSPSQSHSVRDSLTFCPYYALLLWISHRPNLSKGLERDSIAPASISELQRSLY